MFAKLVQKAEHPQGAKVKRRAIATGNPNTARRKETKRAVVSPPTRFKPRGLNYAGVTAAIMLQCGWPFTVGDAIDGMIRIAFSTPFDDVEVRLEPAVCTSPVLQPKSSASTGRPFQGKVIRHPGKTVHDRERGKTSGKQRGGKGKQ